MIGDAGIGRLLSRGPLLLDFDGPVASIFGGYPAPTIAEQLRRLVEREGVSVADKARHETDPMEVLRWTSTLGNEKLTRKVEDALCRAEMIAVETAIPDRYGHAVITKAREIGKPVAIVSNNSAGAIVTYLAAHNLTQCIAFVAGRAYAEPTLMKPNPEPILRAANALNAPSASCTLVGDSLFDIEGARAAQMPVIAYANKAPKVQRFMDAKADIVITSMADIVDALAGLA